MIQARDIFLFSSSLERPEAHTIWIAIVWHEFLQVIGFMGYCQGTSLTLFLHFWEYLNDGQLLLSQCNIKKCNEQKILHKMPREKTPRRMS